MASDDRKERDLPMENLSREPRRFVQEVLKQQLMRFDILRFFYDNPYAILTISDLSVWMSREERPLTEALQQLAAQGYLTQSPASAAFVLTRDVAKRRAVGEFFGYLDDHPDLARKLRSQLRRRVEAD